MVNGVQNAAEHWFSWLWLIMFKPLEYKLIRDWKIVIESILFLFKVLH